MAKGPRSSSSIEKNFVVKSVQSTNCPTCFKAVDENDNCVMCEYCDNWFHAKCAGVNESLCKAVGRVSGFKFFCQSCEPKVDRLLTIERRMDEMEARFEELSVRISNFSIPKSFTPPLNENVFNTSPQSFNDAVQEAVELKLKSHNAVLFGVPETDDGNDLEVVRNLLGTKTEDKSHSVNPADILYTFRDGPSNKGYPRFLKVVCSTNKVRQNFIHYVNKIVKPISELPLRARPDLTYKQRQNGKALRLKLTEFGNDDHYINYQKCAIFSNLTKKCVFSLNVNQ